MYVPYDELVRSVGYRFLADAVPATELSLIDITRYLLTKGQPAAGEAAVPEMMLASDGEPAPGRDGAVVPTEGAAPRAAYRLFRDDRRHVVHAPVHVSPWLQLEPCNDVLLVDDSTPGAAASPDPHGDRPDEESRPDDVVIDLRDGRVPAVFITATQEHAGALIDLR